MSDAEYPYKSLGSVCPRCRIPGGVRMYYRQLADGKTQAWAVCDCGYRLPIGCHRTEFDAESVCMERLDAEPKGGSQ